MFSKSLSVYIVCSINEIHSYICCLFFQTSFIERTFLVLELLICAIYLLLIAIIHRKMVLVDIYETIILIIFLVNKTNFTEFH